MDINAFLLSLGIPGFFSSRAFTPAFVTALVLRYGDQLPGLKSIEFLQTTGAEPVWFTSNWCILILGVLAGLEIFATKSPEAEEMLAEVHKYAKTGMTFLTTMGIFTARDANWAEGIIQMSTAGVTDVVWAGAVASLTLGLTTLRNGAFAILAEGDPDDDLGLRGLLSWLEDTWGTAGVVFLLLFPIVMLVAIGLIALSFFGLRRYAAYKNEKSKTPCAHCETPIYQSALHCPGCGTAHATPKAVGLFGGAKLEVAAPPPPRHALRLASKRRCPRCATRLPDRNPHQVCTACGTAPFADPGFVRDYLAAPTARLPKVLLITALLGLIPVLGAIPAIIYYRFSLVAPFRGYLSFSGSFFLRWFIRLLFLVLLAAQFAAAGFIAMPLMALISFTLYRRAFRRRLESI